MKQHADDGLAKRVEQNRATALVHLGRQMRVQYRRARTPCIRRNGDVMLPNFYKIDLFVLSLLIMIKSVFHEYSLDK